MSNLQLDPKSTALILIDLQHGVVGRPLLPHLAADVLRRSAEIAAAMRAMGGTVVYVRVDVSDMIYLPCDAPTRDPNAPPLPAIASEIVPESGIQNGDLLITKRQWGAFYGNELDQQFRRRGIRTIIMAGIATNFGVESTARGANDRGYALVFAEDAMSSISTEAHEFAIKNIFPRIGRVRSTQNILTAMEQ